MDYDAFGAATFLDVIEFRQKIRVGIKSDAQAASFDASGAIFLAGYELAGKPQGDDVEHAHGGRAAVSHSELWIWTTANFVCLH